MILSAIGGFLVKTLGGHILKGGGGAVSEFEAALTGLGFRGAVGLFLGLFIGHADFRACVVDLFKGLV